MNLKENLYFSHVESLQQRVAAIREHQSLQGLVIHAGQPHRIFGDDMDYPFKASPHFKQWLPLTANPHCWLIVDGQTKPKLLYFQPVDFWHKVEPLPQAPWVKAFEVVVIADKTQAEQHLPGNKTGWAYLGEHQAVAQELGFEAINPQPVVDFLHYHRSFKTEWEQACMREANRIASLGHMAAKDAFYSGASEFEIQQAYIKATEQGENDAPYNAIIALNQNAAILHYTVLERRAPAQLNSFLIDAGANCNGYASDITRTYAFSSGPFADMIERMDKELLEIIEGIRPGVAYQDLHLDMHQRIGSMLRDFELSDASVESLVEQQVTRAFFPHGLGHMLGLQVHDVAGFMQNPEGSHQAAPEQHPFLRCTRELAAGQVLTVEPGLYVIDSLLDELSDSAKKLVNWAQVDVLRPFGGIRIEDNVLVTEQGSDNLTRAQGL
ncbi:Xaa-Pro dipeptidase [Paraferrimonas sedimenticola]|uniref:Xaa-Pro dipeptidase n=1 Tax=Paraferrimonas sedimenticola TaxID=375674 RepID=A0AA37RZR7_9GAMM|nr:Xaa-Pro dipeptidase [Paraferrimonas sedimenticola]GLP97687.1 Xaa-Pro dipeptidase [Paraferrimonas sedimenticola]